MITLQPLLSPERAAALDALTATVDLLASQCLRMSERLVPSPVAADERADRRDTEDIPF